MDTDLDALDALRQFPAEVKWVQFGASVILEDIAWVFRLTKRHDLVPLEITDPDWKDQIAVSKYAIAVLNAYPTLAAELRAARSKLAAINQPTKDAIDLDKLTEIVNDPTRSEWEQMIDSVAVFNAIPGMIAELRTGRILKNSIPGIIEQARKDGTIETWERIENLEKELERLRQLVQHIEDVTGQIWCETNNPIINAGCEEISRTCKQALPESETPDDSAE